jgi:hypothetical protein
MGGTRSTLINEYGNTDHKCDDRCLEKRQTGPTALGEGMVRDGVAFVHRPILLREQYVRNCKIAHIQERERR